jgi:hypothetical protein
MADGFWNGNSVTICTDSFSLEEVLLLANAIIDNFYIMVKVNKCTSNNGNKC